MNFDTMMIKQELKELAVILPLNKKDVRSAQSRMDKRSLSGKPFKHERAKYLQQNSFYLENKEFARYCHLAYAYIRGLDYEIVESSVREGNEPDLDKLADVLHYFQVSVHVTDLIDWLPFVEPKPEFFEEEVA